MIDLTQTKEQLLTEINVSRAVLADVITDPADRNFVSREEACLAVSGATPGDLVPILSAAYVKRFADLPPQRLFRELIYPLKKAVGNAYKRGNQKDPEKRITVETVATRTGALVAVTDEGQGFDVETVLERFQRGEKYFSRGGSGFKHFHKARSLISYVNGGRTVLIRILF